MTNLLFSIGLITVIVLCVIDNMRTRHKLHRRIAELADALLTARALIIRHHDCGKPIVWGQFCPHCHRSDGTEPELDKIARALKKEAKHDSIPR